MSNKHNDCILGSSVSIQGVARLLSFTLIELLVVIVIIGLLTSFLMPALGSAKDRAKTIQCMNNLHQIGIAVEMRANDYSSYPFHNAYAQMGNSCYASVWSFQLSRYLGAGADIPACEQAGPYLMGGDEFVQYRNKRSPVLECPSSVKSGTNLLCTYSLYPGPLANTAKGSNITATTYPCTVRPSEILLMADGAQTWIHKPEGGEAVSYFTTSPDYHNSYDPDHASDPVSVGNNADSVMDIAALVGNIRFRHRNNTTANFLFVDGHVASLKANQVLQRNVVGLE